MNLTWKRSTACMGGACVEVAWTRPTRCANGACLLVAHHDGRILLRDSKRGDRSGTLDVSPDGWAEFVAAATRWDRTRTAYVGGLRLMNTHGVATDLPVCVARSDGGVHLHFTWEEWDAFVAGVEAGEFGVEVLAG